MGAAPARAGGSGIPEKRYRAGQVLFREGDDSRELYILLEGSVEILKQEKRLVVVSDPGSYFGEMSTLLGSPRTATARVIEDARMVVASPASVEVIFGRTPKLALDLAKLLAERLSATTTRYTLATQNFESCQVEYQKTYDRLLVLQSLVNRAQETRVSLAQHLDNVLRDCAKSTFLEAKGQGFV